MHRSASPRPGYSGGRSGSLALGSPRLGVRDRAIAQLQGDESPALSFLARRGSEAQNTDSDCDDSLERQVAMANAERELKVSKPRGWHSTSTVCLQLYLLCTFFKFVAKLNS